MNRQHIGVAVAGTLVAGALAVAIAGPALAWSHPGQSTQDADRDSAEQRLTRPILDLLGLTEAQVLVASQSTSPATSRPRRAR
jgi:hypothetical protein